MQRVTVDSATNAVGDDGVALAIGLQRLHTRAQRAWHQRHHRRPVRRTTWYHHTSPAVQSGRKVSVLQCRHAESTVRTDVRGQLGIALRTVDDDKGHTANALLRQHTVDGSSDESATASSQFRWNNDRYGPFKHQGE